MRRISLKYAKKGMILGAPVYDSYGTMLFNSHIKLDEDCIEIMKNGGVSEIFLDDWRVADVPVKSMYSPELEGRVARALRQLMLECNGKESIDRSFIDKIVAPINAMARELATSAIGEVTVSGCVSLEDYMYIQPMKTASLAMALADRYGVPKNEVGQLGIAAVLKDVGYISIPRELLNKPELLTEADLAKIRKHSVLGYELLRQHDNIGEKIARAVLQHHERWNGSGYPQGLKGADISPWAQIISISDNFTTLLSNRPGRRTYMPHETIEYVMAYSGDQFNPDLVELFVRQVPCYSSGLSVELNTGEMGIISDPNLGFVARPIVRICYDTEVGPVKQPYDINLARPEFQQKLIVKVLDYY